MINNQDLNRLSEKINQLIPAGMQSIKSDFEAKLKLLLQQQLSELEFVSREEFDIQSRVLQRTRTRLEALESRINQLEERVSQ
ncbi:MAG: BMFP domain-containing protein YqiC [Parasphingorhabdus sp.]|jgi:BMFP domain-containing protein YqiC